jgi:hypothetical protein
MYLPPLGEISGPDERSISSWQYRSDLIAKRLTTVGSDVVCLQEVSPESFETDFAFMKDDLGYDGCEVFKRGRFRPATFWKTDRVELVVPPIHKDRTLLTIFRTRKQTAGQGHSNKPADPWFVLNCHLQSGPNGPRRVRQIDEGMRSILTAARKLKSRFILLFCIFNYLSLVSRRTHTQSNDNDSRFTRELRSNLSMWRF